MMRFSPILILPVMLAACTLGPAYKRPDIDLTSTYVNGTPTARANADWWRQFNDPLLDRIVDRALAQNLDLTAAAARVTQARAVARSAGAALLPTFHATGSVTTVSQSLLSPVGEVSNHLGFPRAYEQYDVGAQASWEIDLFGRLRGERNAARAALAGTVADQAAVRLSIVSETVDSYLTLRGLQAELDVTERQVAIERSLVDLIRQRFDQGIAAQRELNRAIGEQRGVEAALSPLRAAIAAQMHRLDILMGQQAGTDRDALTPTVAIPAALVPSGSASPGDLLRRRPDLVAAEQRLIAANAGIGTALANYYPRVSLGGLLNVISLGTGNLFTGDALQASGGLGLRWRLFDFGRIDADVARARGREAEALANYRASVLRATEDVETALVRLTEGQAEMAMLEKQIAALSLARDQARTAYESGAVALLDVLDADRAVLDASSKLARVRAGTARASVAAVRALGGGYSEV